MFVQTQPIDSATVLMSKMNISSNAVTPCYLHIKDVNKLSPFKEHKHTKT